MDGVFYLHAYLILILLSQLKQVRATVPADMGFAVFEEGMLATPRLAYGTLTIVNNN